MNLKLTLLRHGQIEANVQGNWHGSTDSALTEFGIRQAKETGRHLSKTLPFDKVFSSPLQRCMDTAKHAIEKQHLDIKKLPGVAEMSIGEWEGMPYQELHRDHDFINQCTKDPKYSAPGGESINDVFDRFHSALESIWSSDVDSKNILIVSHGAALAIALAGLVDQDVTKWQNYHFTNCSLTELIFDPVPRLGICNSSAHLTRLG